jgi:hypothetical protein
LCFAGSSKINHDPAKQEWDGAKILKMEILTTLPLHNVPKMNVRGK